MPSFRELIKLSSGLGEGVPVRDHLNALGSGTGTGTIIVGGIRSADIGIAISGNISKVLSGNMQMPELSADKGVVLSASIDFNLEGEICQQ